ncbi:tRNA (adenosine(37)-N6)-dimethylallyltransferase MiaA [Patescibacteria group bacterium]|nr:tRNA (adenosine(37)-N6)-dimethylallyltransferase MiaA [Patescibacteria group bacterium]
MKNYKGKLLVVCGLTATGKTKFAVSLAKKYDGELVSADSRQVYIGMDVGTGKDHPIDAKVHLVDVVNPDEEFNVYSFYLLAWKAIKDIWKKGKLPILVGGTGFYIKAIVDGVDTLEIPPNPKVREGMKNWKAEELFNYLSEIDSVKAASFNKSDKTNPRRLIRAIEVDLFKKDHPNWKPRKKEKADVLMIGMGLEFKEIYKRIDERVLRRISAGSEKEVKELFDRGFSWSLPAMQSMGYIQWKPYFEKKIPLDLVVERWQYDEHSYARRQMAWFKKDKRIFWFDINQGKWEDKANKKINNWLSGKNTLKKN